MVVLTAQCICMYICYIWAASALMKTTWEVQNQGIVANQHLIKTPGLIVTPTICRNKYLHLSKHQTLI